MNLPIELQQLHLLRPWWLLAAVPALLLTFSLWRARSGGGDWARAIAPTLLQPLLEQGATPTRRRWLPLLLGGWLLATLALAGPAWQQLPQPVLQRSDALVIVLDLSLSMLTEDVTPSRLQRARYKLQDVLAQRSEGSTALVAYSGSAHVVAPLTDDTATLANLLPALSPQTMPLRGSDPAAAIALAIELLQQAGELRGRILLISDGIRDSDVDAIASLLDRRWQLSILGVGTLQGAPLPLDDGFARDADGSIAIPTLSRAAFEQLAQRSDGHYRELSADGSDIDALLAVGPLELNAAERRLGDTRQFDQWHDRGALLALLLLPLAALLFRRGWLLMLPLLVVPLLMLPASPAQAQGWEQEWKEAWRDLWLRPDQQAARALEVGDAAQAAKRFEDPGWRGAARYRAGDYAAAAEDFAASDGALAAGIADYNRGNALARAGRLEEAIQAYDAALQDDPQLEDARFNRELVEKLLQQQSSQPNNAGSESDNNQQQESDQSDQQQGQQQNDQQQKDSPQDSEQSSSSAGKNRDEPSSANDSPPDDSNQAKQGQDGVDENPASQPEPPPAAPVDQPAPTQGKDSEESDASVANSAEKPGTDDLQQRREAARTEQWLRQIPDEPGGLLQRKFLYEQRLRERDGETRAPDQPAW